MALLRGRTESTGKGVPVGIVVTEKNMTSAIMAARRQGAIATTIDLEHVLRKLFT